MIVEITKEKGQAMASAALNQVLSGFLLGSGMILASMLFRAVLHAGFCG